jgi:hypothetical protein
MKTKINIRENFFSTLCGAYTVKYAKSANSDVKILRYGK